MYVLSVFFFSSRRRHTRCSRDWSSDVCSSDLPGTQLTMRTFHIGGAAQVNETSHLEAISDGIVQYRDMPTITDRKSTRLNSSHGYISYAVFCLKKKKTNEPT